jgi:putative hemolysin
MSELAIQRYLSNSEAHCFVPAWGADAPKESRLTLETENYWVSLAQSHDEVREAQQLRYQVFSEEYGAVFLGPEKGLDQDQFDGYCDHIVVRNRQSARVVGTYRILLPAQARRAGGYYSQHEFFLTRLERQIGDLVELGRSCVHPDHRSGAVIMLLWKAIAQYMHRHRCQHLIGCASVSMRDGGIQAASLWDRVCIKMPIDPTLEAYPKNRLPLDQIVRNPLVTEPPLLRAYLSMGAVICSEPSWDPDFNTADFLVFLDLSKISPRYARHFGL